MIASRRNFLLGASAFLASPSIVRVASLMPVSVVQMVAPRADEGTEENYDHSGRILRLRASELRPDGEPRDALSQRPLLTMEN